MNKFFKISEQIIAENLDEDQIESIKKSVQNHQGLTKHQLAFLRRILTGRHFYLSKEMEGEEKFGEPGRTEVVFKQGTEIEIVDVRHSVPIIEFKESFKPDGIYLVFMADFFDSVDITSFLKTSSLDEKQFEDLLNSKEKLTDNQIAFLNKKLVGKNVYLSDTISYQEAIPSAEPEDAILVIDKIKIIGFSNDTIGQGYGQKVNFSVGQLKKVYSADLEDFFNAVNGMKLRKLL